MPPLAREIGSLIWIRVHLRNFRGRDEKVREQALNKNTQARLIND